MFQIGFPACLCALPRRFGYLRNPGRINVAQSVVVHPRRQQSAVFAGWEPRCAQLVSIRHQEVWVANADGSGRGAVDHVASIGDAVMVARRAAHRF